MGSNSTNFDRIGRKLQNLVGERTTERVQAVLGEKGSRFIRELLGRNPRHRVQVDCNSERFGTGRGAWAVDPDGLSEGSVVYSLGVGDDISFDLALIERFGLTVFAFDPTPGSLDWVKSRELPCQFKLNEHGIAARDGSMKFYNFDGLQFTTAPSAGSATEGAVTQEPAELPVYRLKTVMERLGHRRIDLLKIDIEGTEYEVLKDFFDSRIEADQILVEYHHRFPGFDISQTEESVARLNQAGFKIFDISEFGWQYSFIRK